VGILDKTVTTVFVLLGGVALVGVATELVVVVAPDSARELSAYEAAPPCPHAPPTPAECRWTEEFTVSDIHLIASYQKGDDSAVLTGASGARWKTIYPDRGPVVVQLDEGDRVTGTIWRGRLTEIAANGATEQTGRAPHDPRPQSFVLALAMVPSGLFLAIAGIWRLLLRRATPAMETTVRMGIGLFFAGLLSFIGFGVAAIFLPQSVVDHFWVFAAVFLAAAIWMTVAVLRTLEEERRTPGILL
jgi:hypothetical protein